MTADSDALPLRDESIVSEIRELDGTGELLKKLIGLFAESAPLLSRKIFEGMVGPDWDAIRQSAHSLKSSSGNMGAARLSNVAGEVEKRARAQDATDLVELVDRLRTVLPQTLEAFEVPGA